MSGLARTQIQKVVEVVTTETHQTLQLACGHSIHEALPGLGTVMRSCNKCPAVPTDKWGR